MGKAGTTYSRSVQQTHALTRSEMPDPGLIFDSLLRREKVRVRRLLMPMLFFIAYFTVHEASCWFIGDDVLVCRPGHPHVRFRHRSNEKKLIYYASHSVFRTSHENVNINETSSYVDLAPLYGVDQDAQNRVRMRNGRGYLHPDTFSEDRLLLLPPATAVLLVLFNRNHNVSIFNLTCATEV